MLSRRAYYIDPGDCSSKMKIIRMKVLWNSRQLRYDPVTSAILDNLLFFTHLFEYGSLLERNRPRMN